MKTEVDEYTRTEEIKRENLIERVNAGKKTFIKVGEALKQLRDERLYRNTHDTFEDFCRELWGFDKSYANRLIKAAKVESAVPIGPKPKSEAVCRELGRIEDSVERNSVWALTVARYGESPTAAQVRELVDEHLGIVDEAEQTSEPSTSDPEAFESDATAETKPNREADARARTREENRLDSHDTEPEGEPAKPAPYVPPENPIAETLAQREKRIDDFLRIERSFFPTSERHRLDRVLVNHMTAPSKATPVGIDDLIFGDAINKMILTRDPKTQRRFAAVLAGSIEYMGNGDTADSAKSDLYGQLKELRQEQEGA
jgi:hypothetical protein